jgi:hypothetical protein
MGIDGSAGSDSGVVLQVTCRDFGEGAFKKLIRRLAVCLLCILVRKAETLSLTKSQFWLTDAWRAMVKSCPFAVRMLRRYTLACFHLEPRSAYSNDLESRAFFAQKAFVGSQGCLMSKSLGM